MPAQNNQLSVIMSVYNGHMFLPETIESILEQTYFNFEFIIIDDGSTDGALEIIKKYEALDNRIIVLSNESNMGLAASLNRGIKIAKGIYIARMDADDLCLPQRLERQACYLDENPQILILGTGIYHIDEEGNTIKEIPYPVNPNALRWNMLFGDAGVVCHPCAMIRKTLFENDGLYKLTKTSQDLELWSRYFDYEPLPIYNLPEPLVKCRWHHNSFSIKYAKLQNHVSNQIRLDTLNRSFLKNYELMTVEAFRTLNPEQLTLTLQDKKKLVRDWFYIWQEFQEKFGLSNNEMKPKYEQIYFRIKNWVRISPIRRDENSLSWLELITLCGIEKSIEFLFYKLRLRYGQKNNQ